MLRATMDPILTFLVFFEKTLNEKPKQGALIHIITMPKIIVALNTNVPIKLNCVAAMQHKLHEKERL